ncbi:hypothetical protein HDU85_003720 [Gaertneriomyces sp. JEL0708]|nr:hypothetical protein HDU85_003720 [Gaertneriomyces sp. JEL0708]
MSPSYPVFPPLTAAPSPSAVVKRLYLCRHGETAANQKQLLQGSGIDESLNATGVRQAEALRDRLAGYEFDLIVSSKLKRTEETAKIVAEPHPATTPYIQVPELAEISWGGWEGTHAPHLRHLLKSWEEGNFEASAPNGETPLQVEQRAVPAVYELAQRPEKSILVIIHGRLLRIIMSSLFHHSLAYMSSFTHHNTCINVVDVIIETDSEKVVSTDSLSGAEAPAMPSWSGGKKSLDDNVPEDLDAEEEKDLKKSGVENRISSRQTCVDHPRNMKFVPIVLDSHEHLPHI